MKIHYPTRRRPRIEMLPLIDIVFLLLVFFIYAMLSMAVHRGLPVRLPASSTAEVEKQVTLSVTLKSDGSIYVNEEPVSLKALGQALRAKAADAEHPGVLIFADRSISYQQLFDVLDEIKKAGIRRVSLQSEKERMQ